MTPRSRITTGSWRVSPLPSPILRAAARSTPAPAPRHSRRSSYRSRGDVEDLQLLDSAANLTSIQYPATFPSPTTRSPVAPQAQSPEGAKYISPGQARLASPARTVKQVKP